MASADSNKNSYSLGLETGDSFRRQGSFRKVLPSSSSPSGDSQLSMSGKLIDRPALSARGMQKAYVQFQQEYCIISEYNMIRKKQDLPGMYVIPSAYSSLIWFGVFFVRQGIYQGGIFRFTLHLPESFPDGTCPRVVFQSRVYHPKINIDSGEMDVNSAFPDWKKNVNHVFQVLHYVRRQFYKVETKFPFNPEAAELCEKDPEEFKNHVRECVKISQEQVYDRPPTDDPHYLTFDHYNEEIHGPVREAIFKRQENESDFSSIGLSWVQPGSLQPFSKPNS